MTLGFAQVQAITALAKHLYDYLPGSSLSPRAYTFAHAARNAGVGPFWLGGSKLPALTGLLEATLDRQSRAFCPLLTIIVREGLKYRSRGSSPVSREDVLELNRLVAAVGYKIPELWDAAFIASLPVRSLPPEPSTSPAKAPEKAAAIEGPRLEAMKARFLALHRQSDRQAAGQALERLLFDLFEAAHLQPRVAYSLTGLGEQIDGSFVLDGDAYLIEAKWERPHVDLAPLLVFREKVAGKSSITRGLFISVEGYTAGARAGIVHGKQPNFMMLDGMHLFRVFSGDTDLLVLLRAARRHLAETGEPLAPYDPPSGLT